MILSDPTLTHEKTAPLCFSCLFPLVILIIKKKRVDKIQGQLYSYFHTSTGEQRIVLSLMDHRATDSSDPCEAAMCLNSKISNVHRRHTGQITWEGKVKTKIFKVWRSTKLTHTRIVNNDTWHKSSHCFLLWIRAAAYTVKNISNTDTLTATHAQLTIYRMYIHSQYDFIIHSKWEVSNNSNNPVGFTFYWIYFIYMWNKLWN